MIIMFFVVVSSLQEHYQPDLEDMEELSDMRQELMDRIQNIMNKSMEYRNSFDNYAYLWVDDRYSLFHLLTIVF